MHVLGIHGPLNHNFLGRRATLLVQAVENTSRQFSEISSSSSDLQLLPLALELHGVNGASVISDILATDSLFEVRMPFSLLCKRLDVLQDFLQSARRVCMAQNTYFR